MRSRYSAYVYELTGYLLRTWHPDTRPPALDLEPTQWLGLSVKATRLQDADHGTVEFVARSRRRGNGGGQAHRLHEHSRFVRVASAVGGPRLQEPDPGVWFYLDGGPDPGPAFSGAGGSTDPQTS